MLEFRTKKFIDSFHEFFELLSCKYSKIYLEKIIYIYIYIYRNIFFPTNMRWIWRPGKYLDIHSSGKKIIFHTGLLIHDFCDQIPDHIFVVRK